MVTRIPPVPHVLPRLLLLCFALPLTAAPVAPAPCPLLATTPTLLFLLLRHPLFLLRLLLHLRRPPGAARGSSGCGKRQLRGRNGCGRARRLR
jgi:hypothetical protein